MRFAQLFNSFFWVIILGKLAFMSIFLKGNLRTPPPNRQPYDLDDFIYEFANRLPVETMNQFSLALTCHVNGALNEAIDHYANVGFEDQLGVWHYCSDCSAVVTYNLYLIYRYLGHHEAANRFLNISRDLRSKI